MELHQLKHMVSRGESSELEFKASTSQLKGAMETLCGFLNAKGGIVLLGIKDNGRMNGQVVSDNTRLEIANALAKIEPLASVEIEYISVDDLTHVIYLQVLPDPSVIPYVYGGRPYIRIDASTRLMGQAQYQQMLNQRYKKNYNWGSLLADGVSENDLDHGEILKTLKRGVDSGRVSPMSLTDNIHEALLGLNLIRDGRLVNAGVVLFSNKLGVQYPQCRVKLACFSGVSRNEFVDSRQCHGHIFRLLDEAYSFIERHMSVTSKFDESLLARDSLERKDTPSLPPLALREALVNAFVHRDYSLTGGAVSVAIYEDRLEIWSDGKLPPEITIDDLTKQHPSRPRNELIANVLFRRDMIEEWGRGTLRVIELCQQANLPTPKFYEQNGAFCVEFRFSHTDTSELGNKNEYSSRVSTRQKQILGLFDDGEQLSLKEVTSELPLTVHSRLIRDDLYHLKSVGLLDTAGRGRGAVWFRSR